MGENMLIEKIQDLVVKVLKEENLCERSAELGQLLRDLLSQGLLNIKAVKEGINFLFFFIIHIFAPPYIFVL